MVERDLVAIDRAEEVSAGERARLGNDGAHLESSNASFLASVLSFFFSASWQVAEQHRKGVSLWGVRGSELGVGGVRGGSELTLSLRPDLAHINTHHVSTFKPRSPVKLIAHLRTRSAIWR